MRQGNSPLNVKPFLTLNIWFIYSRKNNLELLVIRFSWSIFCFVVSYGQVHISIVTLKGKVGWIFAKLVGFSHLTAVLFFIGY